MRITTVPQSLRTLLKGQLRFMNQYYEVVAVASDGDCFENMLEEQGVRGIRISMTRKITPFRDLRALLKLIFLFLREKPEIVHTHTPKAGILGMLAAYITGVPHRLHTVAGLPLLVTTGNKRRLLNFVEKLTYACATKIYPNSFELKKIIIANKLTVPDKLKVLGNGSSNGIDVYFFSRQHFPESREKIREHLGIAPDTFTFCFVGRIVRDKGMNELIHAFSNLYTSHPNLRLLIVGPFEKELDPVDHEVEEMILHHPAIRFVGWQADVRPFLVASDALVFPSYREGFPNVVMQAGAMDLPSIVTDINGCNEIIIEGKNGMIVPPRNVNALHQAMHWFITHPKEVEEMAANARSLIVSRYEQQKVWEALLKEYQSLLKNS